MGQPELARELYWLHRRRIMCMKKEVWKVLKVEWGRDRQVEGIGSWLCRFRSNRLLGSIYLCRSSISHLTFNLVTRVIPSFKEVLLVVNVLGTLREQ